MTPLWTTPDLLAALNGEPVGTPRAEVTGISIDTRTLKAGDLFFAIRGEARDGHDFVQAAFKAGAAAAVIAQDKRALCAAGPCVVVEDVLAALVKLGIAARARSSAGIAGVTGSVGKTGTKEALRLALSRSGETHASVASYNNHWGVPLTLARMPASAAYGVFEIGMSHAGEITPLTGYVRPHVAIITTIEPVHLEFFPNVEAIAEAKAEILLGLEPGGAAVLNRDNPHFERLALRARERGARIVGFGAHAEADARMEEFSGGADGSSVRARILGTSITYRLGAPGRHVALNSLAVLAAVSLLGADLALGALALADLAPPPGRGARISLPHPAGGTFMLVDESYNANPASMRAALDLLAQMPVERPGRRIAILGDMRELGPDADRLHAELAAPIDAGKIDLVHACGPHMRALWNALPASRRGAYAASSAELEARVVEAVRPGDIIMIKGSLGTRMGPILEAFKVRYGAPAAPKAAVKSLGD